MKSNRGSVSLIGVILTTLLSLKLLYTISSLTEFHIAIKERSQLHLCFHYLITSTKSYISGMAKQNIAIKAAHTASFIPSAKVAALSTLQTLKAAQQVYHFSYLKNFASNDYCSFTQGALHIKNMPYGYGVIKRSLDQTARPARKSWQMLLPSKGLHKNSKYSHLITSQLRIKGRYQGILKLKNYEIGKEEARSLKQLYGALSSFSWPKQILKLKSATKKRIDL